MTQFESTCERFIKSMEVFADDLKKLALVINACNDQARAELRELKENDICVECGAHIENYMKEEMGDTDICYKCYQEESYRLRDEARHPDERR